MERDIERKKRIKMKNREIDLKVIPRERERNKRKIHICVSILWRITLEQKGIILRCHHKAPVWVSELVISNKKKLWFLPETTGAIFFSFFFLLLYSSQTPPIQSQSQSLTHLQSNQISGTDPYSWYKSPFFFIRCFLSSFLSSLFLAFFFSLK